MIFFFNIRPLLVTKRVQITKLVICKNFALLSYSFFIIYSIASVFIILTEIVIFPFVKSELRSVNPPIFSFKSMIMLCRMYSLHHCTMSCSVILPRGRGTYLFKP